MRATLKRIRGPLATVIVIAVSVLLAWFAASAALSRTASAELPTGLSSLLQADYGEDEQPQVIPRLDSAIIEEIQQEEQRPTADVEPSTRSFAPIFLLDGGNQEPPPLPTQDDTGALAQPPGSEPDAIAAPPTPDRPDSDDLTFGATRTPAGEAAEPVRTESPQLTADVTPPRPTARPTQSPDDTRTAQPTNTPRLTLTPRPTHTPRPPTSTPVPPAAPTQTPVPPAAPTQTPVPPAAPTAPTAPTPVPPAAPTQTPVPPAAPTAPTVPTPVPPAAPTRTPVPPAAPTAPTVPTPVPPAAPTMPAAPTSVPPVAPTVPSAPTPPGRP